MRGWFLQIKPVVLSHPVRLQVDGADLLSPLKSYSLNGRHAQVPTVFELL